MKDNNKQYAFWSYDCFPFTLGGTITKIIKDKTVETEEFGRGYYFKATRFTSKKSGREMRARLEDLATKRTEAMKTLEIGFKKQLNDLWAEFEVNE